MPKRKDRVSYHTKHVFRDMIFTVSIHHQSFICWPQKFHIIIYLTKSFCYLLVYHVYNSPIVFTYLTLITNINIQMTWWSSDNIKELVLLCLGFNFHWNRKLFFKSEYLSKIWLQISERDYGPNIRNSHGLYKKGKKKRKHYSLKSSIYMKTLDQTLSSSLSSRSHRGKKG